MYLLKNEAHKLNILFLLQVMFSINDYKLSVPHFIFALLLFVCSYEINVCLLHISPVFLHDSVNKSLLLLDD